MTTLSATSQYPGANSACRLLPGDGTQQVQPKAPLLQLLRVAGAQEETFTLKEVMHYLGQYIMGKQLYDKQRQHIVHCQDDPLGELLEVESFSVKNPSPVYEMLKKNLIILNSTESLDGVPRSACKRPKLDVNLEEWDLSGLPWWFLGNLRSNYGRKSNGSTDIHTNQPSAEEFLGVSHTTRLRRQLSLGQDEDTAIVSDTTDDLWFLNEAESEQVSVEMKEAALEQGSDWELQEEEEGMLEELDEDSQCLSDDTDTEISIQDAWQCTECRKYNSPLQRYCVRCWALRRDWYKDCPRPAHSVSLLDLPSTIKGPGKNECGDGVDVPDCQRTVSDPVVLPSHNSFDRRLPLGKGKARLVPSSSLQRGGSEGPESSEGDSQDTLDMETDERPEALLEPCRLCRVRPRNGNIIHGRTAHLLTCFSCARKLHKFQAPCPGCGQIIQKVIKTFIA
ncbi:protein Mdm4-like [Scleropages formosus]|uniref:Protein Mdm4-like n=1 Tax=Scleropages formosus TaxID=113540 RepID=A0A0P7WS73_SCLFO|nr:protein Mdm4-like [Scleropages formosus]